MRASTRVGGLFVLLVLQAGCPPRKPPVTAATVKAEELPSDVAGLNAYVDEQMKQGTPEAVQNALVALQRALGLEQNYESHWRAARAYAWLGEEYYPEYKDKVAELAEKGMSHAEAAVKLDGGRVEGHYYKGITTGQFTQVNTVRAKDLVPQVLEASKRAVELDEKYDNAGPLRLLGALYAEAPAPPTSVGDIDEGKAMLGRAVELAPAYPQNHLLLGDAYRKDKNLEQAEREYQVVLAASTEPSWAHRLPKWRKAAEDGLRRVENLRRQKSSGRESPF